MGINLNAITKRRIQKKPSTKCISCNGEKLTIIFILFLSIFILFQHFITHPIYYEISKNEVQINEITLKYYEITNNYTLNLDKIYLLNDNKFLLEDKIKRKKLLIEKQPKKNNLNENEKKNLEEKLIEIKTQFQFENSSLNDAFFEQKKLNNELNKCLLN